MALEAEKGQQGDVQMSHGIFQAADAGGVQHHTRGADHKNIPQILIKDDFRTHPGVGATEHRGRGVLALDKVTPYVRQITCLDLSLDKTRIAGEEPFPYLFTLKSLMWIRH